MDPAGPPRVHRLLPPVAALPDMPVRNVGRTEPWDGAGVAAPPVPLPLPPDGLQGVAQPQRQGGARAQLPIPTAQVPLPRAVLLRGGSLRSGSPPQV
jgi:hypothetical protein